MTPIEIDIQRIRAASGAIPAGTPIVMVNLLRYNEQADYGDLTGHGSCSGREAYFQRYIPAFIEVAAGIGGIQPLYLGSVFAGLIGPVEEQWDDVGMVEYPNFAAFRRVVESPSYEEKAAPHRKAALRDWRLIATIKMTLP